MLCEKCNEQEATVHVTEVVAEVPDEMKKHDFCDACFSKTEFARKFGSKVLAPAAEPGATSHIFPNDDEPGS